MMQSFIYLFQARQFDGGWDCVHHTAGLPLGPLAPPSLYPEHVGVGDPVQGDRRVHPSCRGQVSWSRNCLHSHFHYWLVYRDYRTINVLLIRVFRRLSFANVDERNVAGARLHSDADKYEKLFAGLVVDAESQVVGASERERSLSLSLCSHSLSPLSLSLSPANLINFKSAFSFFLRFVYILN